VVEEAFAGDGAEVARLAKEAARALVHAEFGAAEAAAGALAVHPLSAQARLFATNMRVDLAYYQDRPLDAPQQLDALEEAFARLPAAGTWPLYWYIAAESTLPLTSGRQMDMFYLHHLAGGLPRDDRRMRCLARGAENAVHYGFEPYLFLAGEAVSELPATGESAFDRAVVEYLLETQRGPKKQERLAAERMERAAVSPLSKHHSRMLLSRYGGA
jgi:hypothetical protein